MVFYTIRLKDVAVRRNLGEETLLVGQCQVLTKDKGYQKFTLCPGYIDRVEFIPPSYEWVSQNNPYNLQSKPSRMRPKRTHWDPSQPVLHLLGVLEDDRDSVTELLQYLQFEDHRRRFSIYRKPCITQIHPKMIHRGIPDDNFKQDYVFLVYPEKEIRDILWAKSK